ncbi:ribonuclease E [Agrobacterium tumefaciens]|uniref:Rne/Rng family ribonuclease n=1 Tax=Agrobacterium tumefaciens complex TaxID=1183400 RepID=UPI000B40683D|nr:ribonuclease E/G [Agrobacterium tumefaciens]MBP2506847.1 ribonuclease E [Agrobacterium tumefaciens]MBP2516751.1 ribonuclease E [Agrobacterium tumefaciens]MBP2575385.1 ribonuclease E [Agrobacterium tumefaciens]MBP2592989.1 ribonuclease E [Agrobacterium tumefaciens]NSY00994.1 ribonuclease E/G [Agrobacterium tumefaciens]
MADKMLIDASHEEETRVVVVRGNRIEEFDFESEHKKQIRGNIYLAKVTRVEPSLQAAFVDYGGNRHGFLAFAEIHPDYYQIPLADRQALLKAEAEDHRRSDDFESADAPEPGAPMIDLSQVDQPDVGIVSSDEATETVATEETASVAEEVSEETTVEAVAVEAPAEEEKPKKRTRRPRAKKKTAEEEAAAAEAAEASSEDDGSTGGEMAAMVDTDTISEEVEGLRRGNDDDDDDDDDHHEKEVIESVGAEDAMEEVPDRVARKPRKQYRIQEVIKRRQILLVQVAKEERGNKGAALTTYLSLAGRYSVLMPNTARGGGISRKITQPTDRKRLKEIARDLEVPQGMGVILRTAGANRTRVEIKRDFEYLMRLWENVRTLTLNSTAPCLVYEEGSLIKRSIRDLYNKDIGEIIVSGEEGYREAKDFMKMLMPSHAKVVQPYRDIHPIFSRSGIEAQLDRMLQPQVTLKSGGYLIINQTEALVSIDVNSGRSTREHSIEETALTTNLEAAEEVARQLRLRDLAGLVVIDFIDMEEKRNNRSVEKKLKDCLKNDRARIQVGRISHFGLLEMSRQRIRASVLESTTQVCQHCGGTGHVRSESSIALHVLRGVEEYLLRNTTHNITVRCTPETALYLLNHKRGTIVDYEGRFGVSIIIAADAGVGAQHFAIDRGEAVENPVKIESLIQMLPSFVEEEDDFVAEVEEDEDEEEIVKAQTSEPRQQQPQGDNSEEGKRKRKRRRRRRGKGGQGDQNGALDAQSGDAEGDDAEGDDDGIETDEADAENENGAAEAVGSEEDGKRKRRRRGKRGGRRNRAEDEALDAAGSEAEGESESEEVSVEASVTEEPTAAAAVEGVVAEVAEEEVPKKPRRTRKAKVKTETEEAPKAEAVETVEPVIVEETVAEVAVEEAGEASADLAPEAEAPATEEKVRANRGSNVSSSEPVVTSSSPNPDGDEPKPRKGGWWQRKGFF